MIELKSKKEMVELQSSLTVDTENVYEIVYRFTLYEGTIEGQIEGNAQKGDRHVAHKSTSDAVNFYGHQNDTVEDNVGTLHSVMKLELIEIFNNPTSFLL